MDCTRSRENPKAYINPEIVDRTPFDGLVKKPSIVNTASSKGIVVRDQKLGNFVAAVAVSISSSLNSINEKLDEGKIINGEMLVLN